MIKVLTEIYSLVIHLYLYHMTVKEGKGKEKFGVVFLIPMIVYFTLALLFGRG